MQVQDVRFEGFDQTPELPGKVRADGREQQPCPPTGPDQREGVPGSAEGLIAAFQGEGMTMYECGRINTTPPQCDHRIAHVVFQPATKGRKILAEVQDFQLVSRLG